MLPNAGRRSLGEYRRSFWYIFPVGTPDEVFGTHRRIVDQSAREAYREQLHLLDHLPIAAGYNDIHLRRLDAGEPVVAQGWKFGYHGYEHYCLEPDGRVTPVEPVYVDPDAKPRHVKDYRRPDGSLVRSGANETT